MKKINILISFAHWEESILNLPIFKKDRVRLFVDSGAFTNFTSGKEVVNLDDYAHFLREHKSIIWRYFNLDKIGDAEQSDFNQRQLEAKGFSPVPVFTKSNKKQTPRERFESLYSFSEKYDFVALGGIAGKLKKKSALEYTFKCCYHLKKWKKDVHILGCGSPTVLSAILPFSADSSASTQWLAYGAVALFFRGKFHLYMSPRTKTYKRNSNEAPLRAYNLTRKQIESRLFWASQNGSRPQVKVLFQSYFRFQEYLLRMNCNYFQSPLSSYLPTLNEVYWESYE